MRKTHRRTLAFLAALLAVSSGWTVFGRQATPPAFGPVNLVRNNGKPQTFKWSFNATPGAARVCLLNGGSSNQFTRVSSANVRLNGAPVFLQNNFNQNVPTLSRSLSVLAKNELTAELASKPGSGFSLWVQLGNSCAGTPSNSAPVITSSAVTTGQWLEPYSYVVGAQDADHDTLEFSLSMAPPGMTIDPASGIVTWTPSGFGAFDVTVRVIDGKGGSASQPYILNVPKPANRPPDLAPLPNRQIPLGASFKLALAADDPDYGDLLSFDLTGGPAGASVTPSPMLVWTPQAADLGPHTLTVRVRDLAGASDTGSFTINVINTNGAPVIDPVADETTTPGAQVTRTLSAVDPDPDNTLTFALVSGPAGLSVSPGGVLAWTPSSSDLGSHQVKVSVADNTGLSDATVFNINVVVPAAAQPVVAVDDLYAVRKLSTLTLPAPGVLANDINALTSQVVIPPSKGTLSLASNGGFTYTPTPPAPNSTEPKLKFELISERVANTPGSNRSHSAVADLNKDGIPEIVLISMAQFSIRRMTAVRGDTGERLWEINGYQPTADPKIVLAGGGAGHVGSLSIGDLDGDGYLEILAVHSDDETSALRRKLIAFNHDGTYRWTSDDLLDGVEVLSTGGMFQIDQADLDADGIPEILVHHIGRHAQTTFISDDMVTVFNADGHIRWTARIPGNQSQEVLSVADIDLDGQPDILIGGAVLDRHGNIRWNVKSTNAGVDDLAVANLDDDPFAEIVYLDRFGGLHAHDHNGAKRWGPVSLPGDFSNGQLAIGDTDGDGQPEILLPSGKTAHAIEVWDRSGNLLRTMALPLAGAVNLNTQNNGGSVTVFDLNSDGRPEVIYQSQRGSFDPLSGHGSLFIFDGPSGAMLHEVHASRCTAQDCGPIVADVNGDGSAEIITGGWSDGILLSVFEAANGTWAQTRPIWNQDTYHVTNVESNGRIPAHETANWLTPGLNNYRVNTPMPAERVGDIDSFTYSAANGAVTSNVATVRLDLLPPNTAPRILSIAPTAASPDIEYLYAVRAVDPDAGETLAFSLPMGPVGMVVGASTGLIRWTPVPGTTGSVIVVVKVTDSQGQCEQQQFTIQLGPPVLAPNLIGQATADAQAALAAAGLDTGAVSNSPSSTVTAGLVMSQSPAAGSLVATASHIDLVVSSGPAPVPVPLLVGKSQSAATALLVEAGFGVTVTRAFSNSVLEGVVMAQSPAAGTPLVPGSVSMTVSAGSGLRLRLQRGAMTAGASIPFVVTAYDLDSNDTATPALDFAVAAARLPFYGAMPAASGGAVTSSASTRGVFRLTATDPVTGHSSSEDFAVTYPREAVGQPSMAETYEGMLAAAADINDVVRQARLAHAASNTGAYRGLFDQMVQRWNQVDINELRLATPFGLPQGFFPRPGDLASLGLTLTADDKAAEQVLRDMIADLQAWTDGLIAPTTSMTQLGNLAGQFYGRATRLNALTMSEAGIIKCQPLITMLLSDRFPAFYSALMSELAEVVANAASEPDEIVSGPSAPRDSFLAELLTEEAIEYIIDQAIEAVSPFHKFMGDMYESAAWAAAVVSASNQFRSDVGAGQLTAIIAGPWMSVHTFETPDSVLEGAVDTDEPLNNVVIIIGPEVFKRIGLNLKPEADNLLGQLATVIKAADLYTALSKVYAWLENGTDPTGEVAQILNDSFQRPSEGLKGCLFSSAADCGQLVFSNGFKSVYDIKPPQGYENLSGLPVPILFIVYNRTTGAFYIDTPVFLPTKHGDGGGN